MIDIRCPRCGTTIETLEREETNSFKERYSKVECAGCQNRPLNTEDRLLEAIRGKRLDK